MTGLTARKKQISLWRMQRTHEGMVSMVTWTMRDTAGCIRRGKMTVSQIQKALLQFEKRAAEKIKETGADHVLYGTKIYDSNDRLVTVEFCMRPMTDEEFYRLTGKARNVMIYALHNHCKSRYF